MIDLIITLLIMGIVLFQMGILKKHHLDDFKDFLKKQGERFQASEIKIAKTKKTNYNSAKFNLQKMPKIFKVFKWVGLSFLLLIVVTIVNPFVTIEAGHRGVVFDKLQGGIQAQTLSEGLHFRIPIIQRVLQIPVRTQKIAFVNTSNSQLSYNKLSLGSVQKQLGSMFAASSDLQDVYVDAIVTYHLEPDNVAKVYQEFGNDYEDKKVVPRAIDSVKTYTAKYKVADILTKREEIKDKVFQDLKTNLEKDHIILEDVNLVNFDFNKQFKDAIEQKQIEEQKAEKEKYILQQIEISSQQEVKKAEAAKQSKILEGEGIAEYNKLIQQEITDNVLEYKKLENAKMAIEKWNGNYPATYMGSDSAIPLINLQAK